MSGDVGAHRWHLKECSPGQHADWQKMTYRDALALDGEIRPCPAVQYMEGELFPDETVWVARDEDAAAKEDGNA